MDPTIRIEGDHFALAIPGSHTITIPLDRPDQLIKLLQARRNNQLRIAERGSPVQSMIDRPRERAAIERFTAAQRATVLEDLGI